MTPITRVLFWVFRRSIFRINYVTIYKIIVCTIICSLFLPIGSSLIELYRTSVFMIHYFVFEISSIIIPLGNHDKIFPPIIFVLVRGSIACMCGCQTRCCRCLCCDFGKFKESDYFFIHSSNRKCFLYLVSRIICSG